MSTIEARKERRGGGFFAIYKPGQGKYVRWGTVVGAGIVILAGAYWLAVKTNLVALDMWIPATASSIWVAGFGLLTFWLVNKPSLAEFMIMTESEMRKVSWPSRREVIASTKVVIFMTLLLGLLLWIVDVGFLSFFQKIGLE